MLTPLLQYGCAAEEAFLFVPLTQDGGTVPYGAGGPGVLGRRLSRWIPQKVALEQTRAKRLPAKSMRRMGVFCLFLENVFLTLRRVRAIIVIRTKI